MSKVAPIVSPVSSSVVSVPLVDRPLVKSYREVSLSSFSYLFVEIVRMCQIKSDLSSELEAKLSELGCFIGVRYLELCAFRWSPAGRPRTLIAMLQFIQTPVWKGMCGHAADALEKSTNSPNEFYLYENSPLTNRFLSVPRELANLNCASFLAGFVSGLLEAANFPAEVSAHFVKERTVYIIKFDKEVMKRERVD